MSTDFEQIGKSIANEQKRIQQLMVQRNKKYQQCMDDYLNHLKTEIHQLDSTQSENKERNTMISNTFENVYERIMMSSQVTLRKIKQTCYEKKQFWNRLIENNSNMSDLQLKKDFYQEKRDAEDRYDEAMDNQKIKKIPYSNLLGKFKQKQNLRDWQSKNKKLQQKVTKGTKTLHNWKLMNPNENERNRIDSDNYNIIPQFTQYANRSVENRTQPRVSGYVKDEDNNFLNNFQVRRN